MQTGAICEEAGAAFSLVPFPSWRRHPRGDQPTRMKDQARHLQIRGLRSERAMQPMRPPVNSTVQISRPSVSDRSKGRTLQELVGFSLFPTTQWASSVRIISPCRDGRLRGECTCNMTRNHKLLIPCQALQEPSSESRVRWWAVAQPVTMTHLLHDMLGSSGLQQSTYVA